MSESSAEFVRSPFVHLDTSDILQQPVTALLGVSETAGLALHKVGIESVFDLGASSVFSAARAATAAAAVGSLSARLGVVPSDWLNPGATFDSLEEIGQLGIEHLRGIDPGDAAELKAALDIENIRELANWPPHARARALVSAVVGTTSDPEEHQSEELRPRMGEYPTERVYYSTLVMLQMQPDDDELETLDSPVSLMPAVERKSGFNKPAVGALLTYSQSWYSQGITLGQLLHCLALAPGEATRIALIDWVRRQRATAEEAITETEQLDQATAHSRALSEVQNAVANEMQSGGSAATTVATSESESEGWSDSSGVVQSILGSSSGGSGGWQSASSEVTAQSSSWSIGSRSVLAELTQTVNDRTEQHASSVRNRRASAVREVSQSEHEQISTRIVANYNHMHALTVQYYEVVQIYRTIAQLHRATRCLFVPLELLDFSGPDALPAVEHFRGALLSGALTRRAASLLADDTTTVAVEPVTPTKLVGRRPELARNVRLTMMARAAARSEPASAADAPAAEPPPPAPESPFRTWNPSELALVSKLLSRPVVRPDSDNLFLPDETELVGLSFAGANITTARIDSEAGSDTRTVTTDANYVEFNPPVRLLEIDTLHVAKADQAAATGTVTLHCAYLGRRFSAPSIPMKLAAGTSLAKVVTFRSDQADRRKELLQHLQANRAHYSQAVFRTLDAATITMLLSEYTWNGRPLAEQVEPRPYTVAGNYLVLPAPVEDDESSGVTGADGAVLDWGRLLAERRLSKGDVNQRLIPIPTGGVFAEAVLGRSNSAEKLDITRFWNWQDSPIPLTPPEIAPVAAGSRATAEGLQPGQLSQPLLNIVNPSSLPDPSGLAAVLGAVASGNMFRDMSGLSGTQKMAENALTETLGAASEAGKIASENMRTQAQKAVAMGQIAADVAKTAIGGHYALAQAKAGASSPKGAGTGGNVQGISGDGARINHGRAMDERKVPGTGGNPSPGTGGSNGTGAGSSGGGGGTTEPAPMDAQPESSFSREAAYADTGAFGYSPEGFQNTMPPVVTDMPPVVLASYGGGGASSFFLQRLKHVTTVLGFFATKPVKVFLNLHKTHFDVLGKVLDAVRRGRQIQNVINGAEANLLRFRDESSRILHQAQSVPQDPLEGIPNWSFSDLQALRDPAVVRARQDYLNRYRETVTKALEVSRNLVMVGERITSESRPLLQELHTAVDNLPASNSAEMVVKQAIYQDVQFLDLYFSKYVSPSIGNAEAAVAYLTVAKENIDAILQ